MQTYTHKQNNTPESDESCWEQTYAKKEDRTGQLLKGPMSYCWLKKDKKTNNWLCCYLLLLWTEEVISVFTAAYVAIFGCYQQNRHMIWPIMETRPLSPLYLNRFICHLMYPCMSFLSSFALCLFSSSSLFLRGGNRLTSPITDLHTAIASIWFVDGCCRAKFSLSSLLSVPPAQPLSPFFFLFPATLSHSFPLTFHLIWRENPASQHQSLPVIDKSLNHAYQCLW